MNIYKLKYGNYERVKENGKFYRKVLNDEFYEVIIDADNLEDYEYEFEGGILGYIDLGDDSISLIIDRRIIAEPDGPVEIN